jgi:hypothetical protein
MQRVSATTAACLCLFFGACAISVSTGCKPSAAQLAARQERINHEVETLATQAQDLQAQGKPQDALSLVDKALANSRYEAHKPRLFSLKVDLLLSQGRDGEVTDLLLATWKVDRTLARGSFNRLHDYYQQLNKHAAIQALGHKLLGLAPDLPLDLKTQALSWQLDASIALKDAAAVQTNIDETMTLLKPEEAIAVLQPAFDGLIGSGQHALALALIAHIDSQKNASPLFREMTVTLTMRSVLATGNWGKVPASFQACVTQLPDDQLVRLMRTVFSTLQRNNRKDLIGQTSHFAVFSALDKTNAVNYAARVWVEDGVATDKKLLPERLDALLNAKVSPVQVGNLFDRYFYEMVDRLDIIRQLCAIGERILAVCSDENTVCNIKVKVLDGAFIVDNYDLAIHMLEQGIPGKDKTWHDMSLPKVKAHRALAQKKPREAVQYFREFMNAWIQSKQEEEYDPTSGIAYSRAWILGRNANRIANILDAIPDKPEAEKARAEARDYFKTALEKAKNDPDAMKLLKEETKGLGL